MIRLNIIRFTGNFIYVFLMGIVISSGLRYQEYLKSVVAATQFNPYPNLLFSSFFFIIVGLLIALPRFFIRVREQGHWKFDWVKFLSIGLPTFYASIAPLSYFVISDTIWPSALSTLLFANGTLRSISGLISGYVFLTSFDKVSTNTVALDRDFRN